jgi:hypothetical protein
VDISSFEEEKEVKNVRLGQLELDVSRKVRVRGLLYALVESMGWKISSD